MAMAACIEVSWTWGAPFSWGLVITEGMIKLATLVWMTKVQLLKHGDRLAGCCSGAVLRMRDASTLFHYLQFSKCPLDVSKALAI